MKKFDDFIKFLSGFPAYQKIILLISIGVIIFFSSCALHSNVPIDNVHINGEINVR